MVWFTGTKVRRSVEAASAAFDACDYLRAIQLGEDAASFAQRHRRFRDEAFVRLMVHRANTFLANFDEARHALDAARLATSRDNSAAQPILLWHVEQGQALLHDVRLESAEAIAAFERAAAAIERAFGIPGIHLFGNAQHLRGYQLQSQLGIADLLGRAGQIDEAMRRSTEIVNAAWENRDGPVYLAAMADRAWLLRIIHDHQEAARTINMAANSIRELDFGTTHPVAVVTTMTRLGIELARLQALDGNPEGVDEGFGEARELAERVGSADLLAEVLGAEVEIAVSSGRSERALEVARELRAIEGVTRIAAAGSLQSQARALVANERLEEAHACFAELLPLCDELRQPVTGFTMGLLAAWVAAELGRSDEAVTQVRHAVHGYGTISAAVGTSATRNQFLSGDSDDRSRCFAITARGAADGVREAGLVALEVAETWREDTLAGTLRANHATLSTDVHDLVTRIDVIRAAIAQPPSTASLEDKFDARTHGEARLEAQLDQLRDQLARTVGEGFARSYVPSPVSADRILEACGDRALLSITPMDGDEGEVVGYTVCSVPGISPDVHKFRLGPQASRVIQQLFTGRFDRKTFPDAWRDVCEELADTLLPTTLRRWLAHSPTELVASADGVLRNVPLAALPVANQRVVADCVPVNRLPLLRLVDEVPERPVRTGPIRVLGAFESRLQGATQERSTLRELHNTGQVSLTEVINPTDLIATLTRETFDLLVLSTHGSGAGLDYRFHLPQGDLSVASLLHTQVPSTVVAAACYSGTDAGTDATGALALLLSCGARDVITGSWALPDSTTGTILSGVYRSLDRGTALPNLITHAQQEANIRLRGANPLSWAGLVATSLASKPPT